MIVTILVAFVFQTISSYSDARKEMTTMLDDVETRMADNDAEIAALKESLGADYLVRALSLIHIFGRQAQRCRMALSP